MTQSLASAQVHKGLEINNSCDGIILILIVGYVCYITITGGSSQHIAGNFDEITTKSGLILFILKSKLRERKETNNLECVKARK